MTERPGRSSVPNEGYVLRELSSHDELRACVGLQEKVWGEGFSERVPFAMLMVARRLGGVVAGAFDDTDRMVGFVFGVTGLEDRVPVHWSDMLATLPECRDRGIGLRLKLLQRELCLSRGVRLMYWTFDPLVSKNAWINMGRLGAVSSEYQRDLYGRSDSPLHRGLATDRLVVRWSLDGPRTEQRLSGGRPPGLAELEQVPRAFEVDDRGEVPEPRDYLGIGEQGRVMIPIPGSAQAVLDRGLHAAEPWRLTVRRALEESLAAGLEVRELVRAGSKLSFLLAERPAGAGNDA